MEKNSQPTVLKPVEVVGMMTFGQDSEGLHIMEFESVEHVELEKHSGKYKVDVMRYGNVSLVEIPRRERNKPIFRDDNSSLSLGRDDRYYFYFSLPKDMIDELPAELVRQASEIANKVIRELLNY